MLSASLNKTFPSFLPGPQGATSIAIPIHSMLILPVTNMLSASINKALKIYYNFPLSETSSRNWSLSCSRWSWTGRSCLSSRNSWPPAPGQRGVEPPPPPPPSLTAPGAALWPGPVPRECSLNPFPRTEMGHSLQLKLLVMV